MNRGVVPVTEISGPQHCGASAWLLGQSRRALLELLRLVGVEFPYRAELLLVGTAQVLVLVKGSGESSEPQECGAELCCLSATLENQLSGFVPCFGALLAARERITVEPLREEMRRGGCCDDGVGEWERGAGGCVSRRGSGCAQLPPWRYLPVQVDWW